MPNEIELGKKLKEYRNIINTFNNGIKEIINKLMKLMSNIELIYNINNHILNNFNVKKRNFQIIQNVNDINKNLMISDIIKINEDNNIINKFEKIIK